MGRYAGFRIPCECPVLRWADIDWDSNRLVIDSPKTGLRSTPLFPRVKAALESMLELTGETEYVFSEVVRDHTNLSTAVTKRATRIGLVWPKLCNSLRASAETDIAREFGVHLASQWVGNSVKVALKYYIRATDDDFNRAAGSNSGPHSGLQMQAEGEIAMHRAVVAKFPERRLSSKNTSRKVKKKGSDRDDQNPTFGPNRTRTCDLLDVKESPNALEFTEPLGL